MALQIKAISRMSSSFLARKNTYFTYSNQISQPLQRTPPYVEAREAVSCIKSGKNQIINYPQ